MTSFYMSAQMRNADLACGILICSHIRHCCLSGIQEPFFSLWSKALGVLQTEKPSVDFPLDALASENGPAEQETRRPSECVVVPVLSLYKDGLYHILQNLLIKAVANSVWHLGFFFAPSKVNWSSAADFNEKRIRH